MGTDTPVESGDKKPVIKNERHHDRRKNVNFVKKEQFQGTHPDLSGFVFEAAASRTKQTANFTRVDERIRALIGQTYDPYVLESIEMKQASLPTEPVPVTKPDGSVDRVEEIKYSKKFDRWLSRVELIEKQLQQVYSIYYGQCDDEMKATLAEDPRFKRAHQSKDTLGLFSILQSVNCSYKSNQEPILTMWNIISDFVKLRQQKGQSVQDYSENFIASREVNQTLATNVHICTGFVEALAREKGLIVNNLTEAEKADLIDEGSERMAAIHFVLGADRDRFRSAVEDFEHSYLMDRKNRYLPNTTTRCTLFVKTCPSKREIRHQ